MDRNPNSVFITRTVNRVLILTGIVLLFTMPALLRWLEKIYLFNPLESIVLFAGFYVCAPFGFWGLWNVERLLGNIQKGDVFVSANVTCLRRIRLCCGLVSALCIVPSYFCPTLFCLVLIMGFLMLMINVVCQVMKAAVAIREENDLTV